MPLLYTLLGVRFLVCRSRGMPCPGVVVMCCRSHCLSLRFDPNATLMHEINLALDDLFAVLSVLHWLAIQVEVLRVNGLLVEELVEFGAQVFHPVVPLCAGAVVT